MTSDRKRNMMGSLAWAAGILGLAFAANFARNSGYFGTEAPVRIVTAAIGLMVVWQGNRLPKVFVPSACVRQARHVAGWSLTLSGLIYAALYAFAPLRVAFVYGCGAIVAGLLITFGYCLSLKARRKTA